MILGPDEAMRAVVSGGARQLLDAAGRRVGEILTERALLAPDTADEARAWAAVADLCEAEDRRRVGEGQDAWGPDVRERITQRTIDEIFGMGPMQEACRMPDAIQVEAQAPDEGWVLLDGDRLARIPLDFASPDAMAAFIRRKAEQAGHRVDDASPAVDFAIPGGRFHAVVAPVARGLGWSCPIITIRLQRLAQPDLATLEGEGDRDRGAHRAAPPHGPPAVGDPGGTAGQRRGQGGDLASLPRARGHAPGGGPHHPGRGPGPRGTRRRPRHELRGGGVALEPVVGSDIMLNDLFRADASGELRWCGIVPGGRKAEALRRLGWSPLREVTQ